MESLKTGYLKEKIEELYKILFERLQQDSEGTDFKKFEISHGELYYKDVTSKAPLTSKGYLKVVQRISDILGKGRICDLGFDITVGPMSLRKYLALNRLEGELPSASEVDKTYEIELQEITKKAAKSTRT